MKILIVDDHPINRALPATWLARRGHEVVERGDGLQALELIAQERFDAVLLDIGMPGLSGLDVCRRLRASEGPDRLHIVAYTAHAIPEMLDEMREAGFDEILIKPINEDGLLRALRLT